MANPYFCLVKHLVIIGLVIPEPASTAAGHRMMQLIALFRDAGYRISFLTAAQNIEFSEKIEIQKIELNNESFDKKIAELSPDLVLFDRYVTEEQFGWRVAEHCPHAVRILDTEDLHFLREARRKAFTGNRDLQYADMFNDVFKREMAAILRSDLSLIISEYEYQLLTEHFRVSHDILFYLPFLTKEIRTDEVAFQDRRHFVSIGNFLHEPNWQTVLRLKSLWKPIQRKLPHAELHIYGAYAPEKVFQLHNEKEGFLVKGRADDVESLFKQCRVLLAPIPFGAGLKGKLWESMQYGLPNVTTSVGAEAMHSDLPWNGFIQDSDAAFVESAVELYQNEEVWNRCNLNAREILSKVFDQSLFIGRFWSAIGKIADQLDSHRKNNYLGMILQHHQFNSTKYMSRWIEEKNKKA